MSKFVGVDWAGKRWIVVIESDGNIEFTAQPSVQAVWDQHSDADQILIDIPIGLPEHEKQSPRNCDDAARDYLSGTRYSTVFDVPSRSAVQTSDYETALKRNNRDIHDDSLGPQKWGFSERIHEVDVFMRGTDTDDKIRESHPEVCFAALANDHEIESSKHSDSGQEDRLAILQHHAPEYVEAYNNEEQRIRSQPSWQRRIGVTMLDDIVDAMILTYTARLGIQDDFCIHGGGRDCAGLPMEILYHEGDY